MRLFRLNPLAESAPGGERPVKGAQSASPQATAKPPLRGIFARLFLHLLGQARLQINASVGLCRLENEPPLSRIPGSGCAYENNIHELLIPVGGAAKATVGVAEKAYVAWRAARVARKAVIAKRIAKAAKWHAKPATLQEEMTLAAAMKGKGKVIIENLGDARFRGLEKLELVSRYNQGIITVHFVREPSTGALMDFKIMTSGIK